MAFFINPNNSAKPKMLLYDVKNECEGEEKELTKEDSMISEVLVVNGEQDVVLFERFAKSIELCLYNPDMGVITSKKQVLDDPKTSISID